MKNTKPIIDLDDDWMDDEPVRGPSKEEQAKQDADILKLFAERERIQRENLFKTDDGRELKKPLSKEQYHSLNAYDRSQLRRQETEWVYDRKGIEKPDRNDLLAAALGTKPCPACQDKKVLEGYSVGVTTGYYETNDYIKCWCQPFRLIQKEFDHLVGDRYRAMDFRTSRPSKVCRLPVEQQAKHWVEVAQTLVADANLKTKLRAEGREKEFQPHNFFFAGSAGSGKTTLASMIIREALWRDIDVERTGIEYSPNPVRWCWVVDAEQLFLEFADWATSRTSENPAPEPVVSVRKIEKAASLGCTPTLVLEELDKGRLTEPRFTFLFNLINAMAKCKGSLIITTNRKIDRFMALFAESESETIRTSGEPLMRRFLENNCIKQFSFVNQ